MKVTLVAHTSIGAMPDSVEPTVFGDWQYGDRNALVNEADTLAHFAGRACYQAWDMPNEKTASNDGYLANIISQGHFSVLEHASATFYIEGVSRNLTHELIRHRHLSYSELSQRYVNMEDANYIVPPAVRPHLDFETDGVLSLVDADPESLSEYRVVVEMLMKSGRTRKEAREAARFYLPSAMETKIVVTGNHRAWRDMLTKRYSVHADAEIRELATELLKQLRRLAPATYQDFPDQPFAL